MKIILAVFFVIFSSVSFADANTGKPSEHVIVQKDKNFSQTELTVNLGDTIIFKNDEKDILHNVYSITHGNEFEIHHQKPGTKTPITIDPKKHQPGVMMIECAIHPNMKLKVKINK